MLLVSPIRTALEQLKSNLSSVLQQTQISETDANVTNRIIYESTPIIESTQKLLDLIERIGIPDIKVEPAHKIMAFESKYFTSISKPLYDGIKMMNKLIDELMTSVNTSMELYQTQLNEIEPLLNALETSVNDLEKQVLEKVTNTSIYDQEVKKIDFSKNTITADATFIDNILLLPIISSEQILPVDYLLTINNSLEAKRRLDQSANINSDHNDSELIQGTYFGKIIGKLDGTEDFKAQSEVNIDDLFTSDFNTGLDVNYTSLISNDYLDISVQNIFKQGILINFISFDTTGQQNLLVESPTINNGLQTRMQLINGNWFGKATMSKIVANLVQKEAKSLRYQGIDVYRGDNIIKRYNYFMSLKHLFPDLLKTLNDKLVVQDIEVKPYHQVVIANRHDFYNYNLSIKQLSFRKNTYKSQGTWLSDLITTEEPIESVDLDVSAYVPNDTLEFLKYWISFDNKTWYPIIPRLEGYTAFNKDKKRRIVLSADNNNSEYLFIGKAIHKGIYLKVELQTNDILDSPAIYSLNVRIKVDPDA